MKRCTGRGKRSEAQVPTDASQGCRENNDRVRGRASKPLPPPGFCRQELPDKLPILMELPQRLCATLRMAVDNRPDSASQKDQEDLHLARTTAGGHVVWAHTEVALCMPVAPNPIRSLSHATGAVFSSCSVILSPAACSSKYTEDNNPIMSHKSLGQVRLESAWTRRQQNHVLGVQLSRKPNM